MRNLLRQRLTSCLLALPLIVFSQAGFAANYILPADFGTGAFSSCSRTGPSYTCSSSINLDGDTVTLTRKVTLVINGDLNIDANVVLSNDGNVFDIDVDGDIEIGENNTIGANLTATGTIEIGQDNTITGNLSAGGDIEIGDDNIINGNVSAEGDIEIGADNIIDGDIIADSGNLDIDNTTVVYGNCTPPVPVCDAPTPTVVHHFSITPATFSASTCLANAITIIAEDSAGLPVVDYINQVTVEAIFVPPTPPSPRNNHGNWSINNADGILSPNPDNDDDGAVNYTFVLSDTSEIILNLSNTHSETLTITVTEVTTGISSTSGSITFSQNIFIITEDPIQIAGRPQAMTIAMWTDDGSGGCSIDTNYNSGAQSLDPSIDRFGVLTMANDPEIGGIFISKVPPPATSITLDFSATPGQASFNLDTTDVGQYRLTVQDKTLVYSDLDIVGTTSLLTVRPFGLAVTNIVAGATMNPGANTPGGAIFTTAGLDFSATVASVLWDAADDTDNNGVLDNNRVFADNMIAPSYAWDTTLLVSAIGFEPATGMPGNLNNGAILAAEFGAGSVTITDLQYTEVGSFTLQSQALDFLGVGAADITGDDIIVGRFIPAFFQIVVTDDGALENTCGVYTYIGEDFGYSTPPAFTVSAWNALPTPTQTQNYLDGFAKLNASSITVDVSTDTMAIGTDGMPLNVSYTPAPMLFTPQNDGTVDYTFGADTIRYGPDSGSLDYSKESNSEIAPFTGDLDPVLTQVSDIEVTTVFTQAFDLIGNQLRFGRIRMSNVHGSELTDLAMPMVVEYLVSPGVYTINSDDSCTTVANGDIVINFDNLSVTGASTITVTNPTAIAGDLGVTLTSPGADNVGDINVSPDLDLSADKWLRWDWNNTGQFDADPNATATFGIFSGNPVQIYIQQTYQE